MVSGRERLKERLVGRGSEAAGQAEVGYTRVENKLFHNITDKMLLVINTSNNGTLLVYILLISVANHVARYQYIQRSLLCLLTQE